MGIDVREYAMASQTFTRAASQGKTAFFTKPYLTGGPGGEKGWRGEPPFPEEMHPCAVHPQGSDLQVRTVQVPPLVLHLHAYYFAEAQVANRGKEQAAYISPMRDPIDAGLHPTNHTDFVVAPLDQLFMLWSAVSRISREGAEIGIDQRVTPLEGLKAMTIWVAEQYGEQASKGSLEAGKLADMVVLSGNPLEVAPNAIKDIQVLETLKEGKTIYSKGR
jgi:hypothetical protein